MTSFPKKKKWGLLLISFSIFILFLIVGLFRIFPVNQSTAAGIINFCQNKKEWQHCYADQLILVNSSSRFSFTLATLKEIQHNDPKILDCHFIAHKLATYEISKNPGDWLSIFNYVNQDDCVNGYIHGALEGKQSFDNNFLIDEKTIPSICESIKHYSSKPNKSASSTHSPEKTCAHSMGHILLVNSRGDIDNALSVCQKLPDELQFQCANGVFMESIVRDNLQSHQIKNKLEAKKDNINLISNLCLKYSGWLQEVCWTESAHFFTSLSDNSPTGTRYYCNLAPSKLYQDKCYFHGVKLIIENHLVEETTFKEICQDYLADSDQAKLCIDNILTYIFLSDQKFHSQADLFCQSLPQDFSLYCTSEIRSTNND